MSIPGFTAEDSFSETSGHYYTSAGRAQVQGAILPGFRLSAFAPSTRTCTGCYLDSTGACVQDCTICVPGQVDGCQDVTYSCPASACCPAGRDACYVAGKRQFCCPPGLSCCHPETNLCCPEQCCFDHCFAANENCCTLPGAPAGCCPADQACTLQGCCAQQNVPCGDQCCAQVLPPGSNPACCSGMCTDTMTDPKNCGGCAGAGGRQPCQPPPHAVPICVKGQCDFVCNDAGWPTKCGSICCPRDMMDCCQGGCTDTMTDPKNCGGCGPDHVCPVPPHSSPTCTKGVCDFVCNSGFTRCGNGCCSPDRCINGVCCPSNQKICNGVCCPTGQICTDEHQDPYTRNCCLSGQACPDGRGFTGCCPMFLPSPTGGTVVVRCINKQCTCLNGGTISAGVCMGGSSGGGVQEVDVWNCFDQSVTVWVVDQTTGSASNKGSFQPPSGECGEDPADPILSVQNGDFVSSHQYVVHAKNCDQNDPQFSSCVKASQGPFVANAKGGTTIGFVIH